MVAKAGSVKHSFSGRWRDGLSDLLFNFSHLYVAQSSRANNLTYPKTIRLVQVRDGTEI